MKDDCCFSSSEGEEEQLLLLHSSLSFDLVVEDFDFDDNDYDSVWSATTSSN